MINLRLFQQLFRFGVIGVLAAMIHFSVVLWLVERMGMPPLLANIFGFACGFQLSYWGHRTFTFAGTTTQHREALPKLLFVQLINLAANESLYYVFLAANIPYAFALLIVLSVLPLFTFFTARWWVFKGS